MVDRVSEVNKLSVEDGTRLRALRAAIVPGAVFIGYDPPDATERSCVISVICVDDQHASYIISVDSPVPGQGEVCIVETRDLDSIVFDTDTLVYLP